MCSSVLKEILFLDVLSGVLDRVVNESGEEVYSLTDFGRTCSELEEGAAIYGAAA